MKLFSLIVLGLLSIFYLILVFPITLIFFECENKNIRRFMYFLYLPAVFLVNKLFEIVN